MKYKPPKPFTIYEGVNGNWFVKAHGNIIASFKEYDDAVTFVKAKIKMLTNLNSAR
jgi:hypothetical protein